MNKEIVFPGDIINDVRSLKGVTVIGPGLKRNEDQINTLRVTRAGKLCFKPPNTLWVEGVQKRYIPKKGDLVVGVILRKAGETIKVDIGSSEPAALSMLAFEGATKKQKPDLQVGDVVYARVLIAHKDMEPELVCVDSYYKAGKLGILSNDGFVTKISLNLVNQLLKIENPLLRTLGSKFPFEIAIGMNGKVWINAQSVRNVMTIVSVLEAAEGEDQKVVNEICNQNR